MSVVLRNIRATEGARKVAPAEGERFDVAGAHLTWEVKGEDSGYAFSVCEQTVAPEEGVPLHSHSFPEAFYRTPAQIIGRILDEVTVFANGRSQRDDVTLLVFGVKDKPDFCLADCVLRATVPT